MDNKVVVRLDDYRKPRTRAAVRRRLRLVNGPRGAISLEGEWPASAPPAKINELRRPLAALPGSCLREAALAGGRRGTPRDVLAHAVLLGARRTAAQAGRVDYAPHVVRIPAWDGTRLLERRVEVSSPRFRFKGRERHHVAIGLLVLRERHQAAPGRPRLSNREIANISLLSHTTINELARKVSTIVVPPKTSKRRGLQAVSMSIDHSATEATRTMKEDAVLATDEQLAIDAERLAALTERLEIERNEIAGIAQRLRTRFPAHRALAEAVDRFIEATLDIEQAA
jgi:hypothetical protein